MKIVNSVGSRLPAVVLGLAKQKAASIARAIKMRPYSKTLAYTTDSTQDVYLIIIKLGFLPSSDRVIIVNGNDFRITSAINEQTDPPGADYFPTVTWKGGTPPFVIKLVWRNPFEGGFYDDNVTTRCININSNLTDGVGDITNEREYIVTKISEGDGWWSDDLETDDLGLNTDPESPEYQQKRQNAIGILIKDSSTPPRQLFAPFAPDPVYDADGITPAGLFSKYPNGQFGPPLWCTPIIWWEPPPETTYGATLMVGVELNAIVHTPGTPPAGVWDPWRDFEPLPGVFEYWLDEDYTIPAENAVTAATGFLPLYVTFRAADSLHYRLAEAVRGIVVNKAPQFIGYLTASHSTQSVVFWNSLLSYVQIRPGETGIVAAHSIFSLRSGNTIQFSSSSPACTVGVSSKYTAREHRATLTFNEAGAFYITATLAGNNNFEEAEPKQTVVFKVGFGRNVPGGVTFDINDSPVTYGEALDVLCWSPVPGNPAYQTAGQPAGWIVDPLPGMFLETKADGTPHTYSVTALFYPLDAVNYPSPMEYEQWLTVEKNTPVPVWTTPASFVYGTKWQAIMNALFYNSHHVGESGWAVAGDSLYEVHGHSKPAWNGIITNAVAIPDVDTGLAITCAFTPTGAQAHNYATPPVTEPLDHAFEITPKPIQVAADVKVKKYGESDPGLSFTAVGLLGADGVTGTLTRAPGENVGSYTINQGTLTAGDNYAISFTAGLLTINKADQTLGTVTTVWPTAVVGSPLTVGDTGTVSVSSSGASGNPVVFTSSNPSVCVVSGNALTIVGVGSFVLTANQAGNSSYNAAPTKFGVTHTVAAETLVINFTLPAFIMEGETLSAYKATTDIVGITFNYHKNTPTGTPIDMDAPQAFNTALVIYAVSVATPSYASSQEFDGMVVKGQVVIDATVLSITYGNPLVVSGKSATHNSGNVAGAWTYALTNAATLEVIATAEGDSSINAGAYLLEITFTPTDTTHYQGASFSIPFIVAKATPTITWATPAAITYGTPLSAAQLNASTGALGWFDYIPPEGTMLDAGEHALAVDFYSSSPNYNDDSEGVWLTVEKATPTITWPTPADIPYGTPLSAAQLNASVNVAGAVTYSPPAGTVLPKGVHALTVTFASSNPNYNSDSDDVWLTVGKAIPTITWPTPAAITYGTPLSTIQLNASANAAGSFTYLPPAGTVLDAGSHALMVEFMSSDPDYSDDSDGVWLTVTKANQVLGTLNINWYNGNLSAQIVVSAVGASGNPVVYTCSPPSVATISSMTSDTISITVVSAGSFTITANQAGNSNYNAAATVTRSFTANKVKQTLGTITVAWTAGVGNPPFAGRGLMIGDTGTISISSIGASGNPVVFTTNPATCSLSGIELTLIGAGSFVIIATQAGDSLYSDARKGSIMYTVGLLTPTITWPTPAAITYGTPLSAAQLNASANASGTFTYSPPAGTVLPAGSQALAVTFNSLDPNYNSDSDGVWLTVAKANPTITWPTPAAITYGTPLSAAQLNASANASGTFTYSPPAGTVLPAGSQALAVTFNSLDPNYNSDSDGVWLTVAPPAKTDPVITWAIPTGIPLGFVVPAPVARNASGAVLAGSFNCVPAVGATITTVGSKGFIAIFTPTDASLYNAVSLSVNSVVLSLVGSWRAVIDGLVHSANITTFTGAGGGGTATSPFAGTFPLTYTFNYTTRVISSINLHFLANGTVAADYNRIVYPGVTYYRQ